MLLSPGRAFELTGELKKLQMFKLYPRPMKSVGLGPRHNYRSSLVSQCSDTAEDPSHPGPRGTGGPKLLKGPRGSVQLECSRSTAHQETPTAPHAGRSLGTSPQLAAPTLPWFWEGSLWDAVFVYLSEKRTRPWGRSSGH